MRAGFVSPAAFLLSVLMVFVLPVHGFDEGIDYRTLSRPLPTDTGDKVEVRELFWYGCPHCYHLEHPLKRWLETQPDYVVFNRDPAVLGRGWVNHARAYHAAEMLGVLERTHEAFFSALHDKNLRLFSGPAISDWYGAQGVDKEEFLRAYKSFIVDVKIRRSKQYALNIGLDGVPTFVINGKYVTSPSMAGGSKRMFELVDYLTALEAGKNPVDPEEAAEDQKRAAAEAKAKAEAEAKAKAEAEAQAKAEAEAKAKAEAAAKAEEEAKAAVEQAATQAESAMEAASTEAAGANKTGSMRPAN